MSREGGAGPFIAAVTDQVARPCTRDALPRATAAARRRIAARVRDLVADPAAANAVDRLCADPRLLSAFFANVDLLFEHDFPGAGGVALLIMQAVEKIGEAE